jgi:tRNA threonylcarbamoyladenosine biosynthesis protein TsaB
VSVLPAGITLALDAAVSLGTVAVLRDGAIAAAREVTMRGGEDERFFPAVLGALADAGVKPAEVTGVACGEGPGSFTSLRVAGAIAKGVAQGTASPLFAVPSLALIVAASDATLAPGGRWLATLDAMRGDRYLALVTVGRDGMLTAVESLGLAPAGEVGARARALGAMTIGPGEATDATPHARGVVRCLALLEARGAVDLASWEPLYGRLAEAQAKLERERGP